ncbi:Ldh family oxidoreductase [Pelagibacteraceae bacterium]|nr:Ldh family oxidoreductase [Pelagibacteraceae bacterium]
MEKRINHKALKVFLLKVLKKAGLDKHSADSVATGLCETSLRGVDSHGIRLINHYVYSAIYGRKNPKPKYKFVKTFPALGVLNADNAFGHAAGMKAIDICMKIASKFGVGIVAVKNSSHPGALASMTLRAARKKFIAFAFTHADSLLLSHNGKKPYFGTNPICFAAPRKEKEPFCIDMATSMISWNKLLKFRNQNKKLDNNLAADVQGNPTIIPSKARSLFGAGSYKGYALASMVEVLCGVLTGMNFGTSIPAMYKFSMHKPRKLGQFYIVFKPNAAISLNVFIKRMQDLTSQVRRQKAKIKKNKVMMPNDPEILNMKARVKRGIPLDNNTFKEMKALSKKFSIDLKLLN